MSRPRPSFNEKKYFATNSQEARVDLRAKVELAAKELQDRKDIAEAVETDDANLTERIRKLGFDGDSARVFDLVPLIHVSWADGKIQADERNTICAVLEKRGVVPGSEACTLIEVLLEKRPSDAFFSETLSILKALTKQKGNAASVVELCIQVAEVSGGLFGFGNPVSAEEKELIGQVADALGDDAQAEFSKRIS